MVLVGKDLVLEGQEGAARIDQVDNTKPVLFGDFLGPHMFLDRHWQQAAAFDRCVVCDEDPRHTVHDPDTGDNACTRRFVVVLAVGTQRGKLEEWRVVVGHEIDAIAHHDLAPFQVTLDRFLAAFAAIDGPLLSGFQRREFAEVGVSVGEKLC